MWRILNERKIESILSQPGLERLKDWYSVGPAQRAALEEFLEAVVKECAEISYNSDESGKDIARDMLYNFCID